MALLSAFAEMGLKLRLDIPEQAMEVTTVFFRTSTPATEAFVSFQCPCIILPFVVRSFISWTFALIRRM